MLFFIVMCRKQMLSLLLASSMGVANSPGKAPVCAGTTFWHG
jgi:hypothetical protein